jgi:hypothetical protein
MMNTSGASETVSPMMIRPVESPAHSDERSPMCELRPIVMRSPLRSDTLGAKPVPGPMRILRFSRTCE